MKKTEVKLGWVKKLLIGLLALVVTIGQLGFIYDWLVPEVKNPNYGASFSIKYARELGLDWRETYQALITEMPIKKLRLMSYWDEIQPNIPNEYRFDDLDWQFEQAEKHGIKVSLAIGFRQPRWPECHQPKWAADVGEGTEAWKSALYKYMTTVVTRYKNHPALESYQLENEALNRFFGDCVDAAPTERLREEYDLVKAADSKHPIYMSLSDQHGLPVGEPRPDAYGFSVYRTVWNDKLPIDFYVTYPTPVWYHRARKWWIETFRNREVFIHELQLEPWGPAATQSLSLSEQDKSMSTKQIKENLNFARKIGSDDIYLWGSEWWYWRREQGDNSVWQTVAEQLAR